MKNSKEMADAVFRIRDEYIEKKRRRNEAVKRAAFVGVPVFAAFALMIGIGAAFDRQDIPVGIPEAAVETAPVTNEVTVPETAEIAVEETNALKETAVTSKAIKKETKLETSPAAEGALPETVIPEGEVPEGQPEIITTTTVTEQTTRQATFSTTVTTTAALSDSGIEGELFQPDEDTDGLPESTETVNEAAFRFNELCDLYPTLHIDGLGDYVCAGETVAADKPGRVLAEMPVGDGAAHAVVYSLENGQIAVKFNDTDIYIVYKAKEDQ